VGQSLGHSDWLEIDQARIDQFAKATGDHQWIHVDVERATAGPFGGPIAHGFLTLSLLPSLNKTGNVRITGQQNVVNYGADGLRFLAPVPVGSSLHARNRVREARQHKKGTLVATQVAIHVVGNEVPSVLYDALVLYQG
jgi:acyl dehydratase